MWGWGGEAHGNTHFHECGCVAAVVCVFVCTKRQVTSHRRSSNEACQCGERS